MQGAMNESAALKIDLALIPESNVKDALIHFAKQHNALVEDAGHTKADLEALIGKSDEDKALSHEIFAYIRRAQKLIHSKRFNIILLSAQVYLSGKILQMFGVSLEDAAKLLDFIRHL